MKGNILMKIEKLMEGILYEVLSGTLDKEIKDVVYDSRKVTDGSAFVCLTGFNADGHAYIDSAIEKGATLLVVEKDVDVKKDGVTVLKVVNSRVALSKIAANYFDNPADKLVIVGVTGTKGKTTTTHMCKSIMEVSGVKVGMIGTIGAYVGNEYIETKNTTPESFEIQGLFKKMADAGCKVVFMEVSSQAVKLDRIAGIHFAIGAFTNLSPDHIGPGEHEDFEEYKNCKKAFFKQVETAVINVDDEYGLEMAEYSPNLRTVSVKGEAYLYATDIKNTWEDDIIGVSFLMHGDVNKDITIGIPGIHNVDNALIAAEVTHLLGADDSDIVNGLINIHIKGRTQLVKEALPKGTFIIDYAHNAISTESVLSTLRAYNPKKLTVLFGGGGNKPVARRHDMGEAASRFADYIILTEDNPRFEEIDDINKSIIEGIKEHDCPYEVIYDRKEAIEHLLDISNPGEIVALIGKGHETYQEVKGVKRHFSEEEVIKEYMKNH